MYCHRPTEILTFSKWKQMDVLSQTKSRQIQILTAGKSEVQVEYTETRMAPSYLLILLSFNKALDVRICDAATIRTVRMIRRERVSARVRRCLIRFGEDLFGERKVIPSAILIVWKAIGLECRNSNTTSSFEYCFDSCLVWFEFFRFFLAASSMDYQEVWYGTVIFSSTIKYNNWWEDDEFQSIQWCKMSFSYVFCWIWRWVRRRNLQQLFKMQRVHCSFGKRRKRHRRLSQKEILSALFDRCKYQIRICSLQHPSAVPNFQFA